MNPGPGWALAALAVAAGYVAYGWQGVVLAATLIVFWLLLQFSRALRVMRRAAARPVGTVASAAMLHARLKPGLTLLQVLPLTGSLGRRADPPGPDSECFVWRDGGGDSVTLTLRAGRLADWRLARAAAHGEQADHAEAGPQQGAGGGLGHRADAGQEQRGV